MIFDLDAREGEWFQFFTSRINSRGEVDYDDPAPDAGRVCVRSLVPYFEERQAKRKKKFEFVLNPNTRAMERVGFYPEQTPEQAREERDDAWDYCIVGLEGIFDGKWNEVACTRENKLRLMRLPVFDRFIARCLVLLSESRVKAEQVAEKNGSTS